MARAAPIQTSFLSGELSPLMAGRVDTEEYKQGLDTCLGYIPLTQGGLTAAPGTYYVATVKDSTAKTMMVRFKFSTTQAYAMEMGNLYCRFYRNDARIESPPGTPVEIVTPYTTAQLFELQFTQSADNLYITHPSHAPRKITRTSHTAWSITVIPFRDGPYLPTNSTLDTMTPSASFFSERANPQNAALNAVAWSGTQFVAVGDVIAGDAYVVTSPDGRTWTERANPKAFPLTGISWSGALYVAVGFGDGTDAYIVTSPDGITWTERANPKNIALLAVTWDGGKFVAVGVSDGTDAYIVTSPDGIAWTERANPQNAALKAVTWSGTQFVAVGDVIAGDAYIVTSPDGITWTERVNPKAYALSGVSWSGSLYAAVGDPDGVDAYIVTSPDGITWTERANPSNLTLYGIVWASNKFFAVGTTTGAGAYVITSPDGSTWTAQSNPKNIELKGGGTWSGTNFIAVGSTDGTDAYIIGDGDTTITASRGLFVATDVGRLIRIRHTVATVDTWGYARVVSYTSPWQVTAVILSAFSAATASTFWRLGVWSDTTGYPQSVAFYEDRLFLAGCTNYPTRLDGSKSGDYENMAPTAADGTVASDNAVSYALGSREVNAIQWMLDDEQALVAGTPGGPWIIRPSKQGEALSPTNVSARRLKSYGSSATQAVHLGDNVAYIQNDGRKLRSVTFGQQQLDGFSTPDLTLASEHITRGGLGQMAVQFSPQPILWGVRGDGVLLGMTFASVGEAGKLAVGWHRHVRGGVFGSGNAVVESVAAIPATDGTRDQLWMIVKRTINGATVRTVEYMKKIFDDGDAVADAFFVDCGITYDGASTATITGLGHLEGQTVSILGDGAAHPDKTVVSGQITLDRNVTKAQVGLAFDARGATMRFDIGAQNGTSQGKTQRIYHNAFRLSSTNSLKAGPSFTELDEVIFRTSDDLTDTPIPSFTGDKEVDFDGDYTTEARVCWSRYKPMPCTILAVIPQLMTEDRE